MKRKKFFLATMIFCVAVLLGCHKDPREKPDIKPISGEEPVQPTIAPTPKANGALVFDGIKTEDVRIVNAFSVSGSFSRMPCNARLILRCLMRLS